MSRKDALDWIKQVLVCSRGAELPGNFNPFLIGELFWEQSQNCEKKAKNHVEHISSLCRTFVYDILNDICPSDVARRLKSSSVVDSLRKRLVEAKEELDKLLTDKRRKPVTYNHYYTMTIQKRRRDRAQAEIEESVNGAKTEVVIQSKGYRSVTDPAKLCTLIEGKVEKDMDKLSASDALDALEAYYKVCSEAVYFHSTPCSGFFFLNLPLLHQPLTTDITWVFI